MMDLKILNQLPMEVNGRYTQPVFLIGQLFLVLVLKFKKVGSLVRHMAETSLLS